MTFAMGGLAQWLPSFLYRAHALDVAKANTMFGATTGVKCGLDFFGASQVLFATDAPLGPIKKTFDGIDGMELSPADKQAVFYGNAARLLKL